MAPGKRRRGVLTYVNVSPLDLLVLKPQSLYGDGRIQSIALFQYEV